MEQGITRANEIDRHVGVRVRLRRRQMGWTQERLAAALDVSFQQVQKYEKGANRISASALYAIAQALNATPASFFEGLDEETSDGQVDLMLDEVLTDPLGVEMVDAFQRLNSSRLRRIVLDLMQAVVADQEQSKGGAN